MNATMMGGVVVLGQAGVPASGGPVTNPPAEASVMAPGVAQPPRSAPKSQAPALSLFDGLVLALLIGLAATTIARVVRARVSQKLSNEKPFSCDLCMAFWSSLLVTSAWWGASGAIVALPIVLWFVTIWLGACALTTWALRGDGHEELAGLMGGATVEREAVPRGQSRSFDT